LIRVLPNYFDNHELTQTNISTFFKFKKLYYKYLRAESFRKSLIYQKKFLLIMLSGYEETEREILTTLRLDSKNGNNKNTNGNKNGHHQHMSSLFSSPTGSTMLKNGHSSIQHHQQQAHQHQQQTVATFSFTGRFATHKAKSRFRKAVIAVIAINRIKFVNFKYFLSNNVTRQILTTSYFKFRFLQKKHSHMLTRVDTYRN
jgi:hypothetical protein